MNVVAIPKETESEAAPKGAELIVYWPADDQWYHGVVMTSKPGRVHIEYEDGSQEWINLKTTEWKLWNKDARKFEREFQYQKKKRLEDLKVGSRLCVFWPFEKVFFTGTLMEVTGSKHLIRYDDGDEEWTNLFHRNFQKISNRESRLQVGSRIVVYNQGEQYPATVVRINIGRPKPHCVKYDCPKKKQEWLNLNTLRFHEEVEEQKPARPSLILRKRKQEFLQDMPELQIGQGWKTKIHCQDEPVVEPSMDQVSCSTTISTTQSTSTRSPVVSSVPEKRPLTPPLAIPCGPSLTTGSRKNKQVSPKRLGKLSLTTTSQKKKKQVSPRRLGKLTTKMLMNYMIREACDDDDSSVMSRVVRLPRLVNHEHTLQYQRK